MRTEDDVQRICSTALINSQDRKRKVVAASCATTFIFT